MKTMTAWKKYVITSYLVFWFMVLGICGCASMVFHAPPLVMRWLSNLCAWSPTIVLFCMFRTLQPNISVKAFFARAFSGHITIGSVLLSVCAVAGVFFLSAFVSARIDSVSFASLFSRGSYPIFLTIVLSLLSGPTGEECGWRGYLRGELEERYGFLKGAILLGVIWAFWHTVLWFVDNEFTSGAELLIYIVANVLVMTSLNVIMSVVLRKHNNLLYAVLIHFCFNLPYSFLQPKITFYVCMSIFYVITAAIFVLVTRKTKSDASSC